MSSISSLTKAVSGLQTAQKGLQVTGHNLSNIGTTGYTRQQLLQHESGYITIGKNGGYAQQVGLGVSSTEIRQIRDELADRRLRTEQSVLCYYQKLTTASQEIENLFDEPYGSNIGDLMSSFWGQAQKLNTAPEQVEERLSFINSAEVLITKINSIADELSNQQYSLTEEISDAVDSINSIIEQIGELNKKIAAAEVNGDHANDYRDQRNLLIDELSTYGDVSYYEEPDSRVVVKFEGHPVVNKESVSKMEMVRQEEYGSFDIPVWTNTGRPVCKLEDNAVNALNENATGTLKALMVARGNAIVTKDTTWSDVAINDNRSVDENGNNYVIPKTIMMLNTYADKLTSMVNECFDGFGIDGEPGVPVFVEIREGLGMVAGNIQVNPELLAAGGYNKLGTVPETDTSNIGDNSKVTEFLNAWGKNQDWFTDTTDPAAPVSKNLTITAFYNSVVTDIGSQTATYSNAAQQKATSVMNIENERQSMGGVSQDEEFSNMIKYQYAYSASARMVTMLDSMLDTIINGL